MITYFARHTENLCVDKETRERIWKEHRIAVHYPYNKCGKLEENDNVSLRLEDYQPKSSDRRVMGALLGLAQEGGYVCAAHTQEARIQIGWVEPGSDIECIRGRWQPAPTLDDGRKLDRAALLKTIQLKRVKILNPIESIRVLAGRPRQGTLTQWPNAGLRIQHLIEGKTTPFTLVDMLPYEQETMCAEFLRMPEAERLGLPRLVHLLMPVGRTMKDVDIVGLGSDEQKIVCQVTFSDLELSSEKLAALRKYDCGHQLIYFCNAKEATDDGHIRVVPLTDVFNEFTATATGKKWMATLKPSDFV